MPSTRRIEVLPQVYDFLRTLAPEPRRTLRLAIRGLQNWFGDIKPLEGDLRKVLAIAGRLSSSRVCGADARRHRNGSLPLCGAPFRCVRPIRAAAEPLAPRVVDLDRFSVTRRKLADKSPRDFGDLPIVVMDEKAVSQFLIQFNALNDCLR